jgi:hypothetical protein
MAHDLEAQLGAERPENGLLIEDGLFAVVV